MATRSSWQLFDCDCNTVIGQVSNPSRRKSYYCVPHIVIHKWSVTVVDEGFVPFPKRLIRCLTQLFEQEGTVGDLQVVLAIVDYARPNLSRPPSYDFLAFNAGMSVQEFKARVEQMEKRGWLETSGPDEAVAIDVSGLMKRITEVSNQKAIEIDIDRL